MVSTSMESFFTKEVFVLQKANWIKVALVMLAKSQNKMKLIQFILFYNVVISRKKLKKKLCLREALSKLSDFFSFTIQFELKLAFLNLLKFRRGNLVKQVSKKMF